jgi:hypothetical protein
MPRRRPYRRRPRAIWGTAAWYATRRKGHRAPLWRLAIRRPRRPRRGILATLLLGPRRPRR